jgi:endonuclease/exonuclease/phosphatase family metal-dependent hydrolase
MNKKSFRLILFFIVLLTSCKEEISPLFQPSKETDDTITTPPSEPVEGKFSKCLSVLSPATLDVVTWNIENFPKNSSTIGRLKEIITTMDPDVIAVQEITSSSLFNSLISEIPGWQGTLMNSGSQRLGYLFKSTEIQSIEGIEELFGNDNCAFPRPALKVKIRHISGKDVYFFNVHLKCCSDATASCGAAKDRRRNASVTLKNYIDQNLSGNMVIILGDWNDSISDADNPFSNFITDAANFKFADMEIAKGSNSGWSYPSWPSHLDHILISNELFTAVRETKTISLTTCESGYSTTISDHFPVIIRLN